MSVLNITSNTTTLVKSGAGKLYILTVNTAANGSIIIYDSLSATGTKIGTLKASVAEQSFFYEADFKTGLCIVTAAATDLTVTYE